METVMDVDYFISKFEAIDAEDIGRVGLHTHCALWHCGVTDYSVHTKESDALANILKPLVPEVNDPHEVVYMVNDGVVGTLEIQSPKVLILAALRDIKSGKYV